MIYIGRNDTQRCKHTMPMVDLDLYEQIFAELPSLVRPGAPVLDLGCCEGALSQRLVESCCEVFSLDKNPSYFISCHGSTFSQVDFDNADRFDGFIGSHEESFDAVFGIEDVEYLENQ